MLKRSASHWRSVTSNTSCSRLDATSSGPNSRKFEKGSAYITSRRNPPSTRVASERVVPGLSTGTAIRLKVGQVQSL